MCFVRLLPQITVKFHIVKPAVAGSPFANKQAG